MFASVYKSYLNDFTANLVFKYEVNLKNIVQKECDKVHSLCEFDWQKIFALNELNYWLNWKIKQRRLSFPHSKMQWIKVMSSQKKKETDKDEMCKWDVSECPLDTVWSDKKWNELK